MNATRASLGLCLAAAAIFLIGTAWAGDKEAHTNATFKADEIVASEAQFVNGVGGRLVDGVPVLSTRFLLPAGKAQCAFKAVVAPDKPCAYATLEGEAVNQPDNWQCLDGRQPGAMSLSNFLTAPDDTLLATEAGQRSQLSEAAATACNWTHFVSNPRLYLKIDNADNAFRAVWNWAEKLPISIETQGATAAAACDDGTWQKYLRRIYNALHFTQDAACEHHADGNLVCAPGEWSPRFWYDEPNVGNRQRCITWLDDSATKATGSSPTYSCDNEVVKDSSATTKQLSPLAALLDLSCKNGPPLACMGLERLFRHHCNLDAPKSLTCFGPEDDHQFAILQKAYCEGETYSGGGQDFLAAATVASTPILEKAAQRWATVCKQPDDPCDQAQCDTWCRRSEIPSDMPAVGKRGFCKNAQPDPQCVMHECECRLAADCGQHDQPCCVGTNPCADAQDVCNEGTRTCNGSGGPACGSMAAPGYEDTSLTVSGVVGHGQKATYPFTAAAGAGVQVRLARTDSQSFGLETTISDPGGVVLASLPGRIVDYFPFTAKAGGIYTVDVSNTSNDPMATYAYTLYVAVAPGANKRGRLIPGEFAPGVMELGAIESFTFTARAGEGIFLRCSDVDGGPLSPSIAVYDPTGTPLTYTGGTDPVVFAGSDVASFSFNAPTNGIYTVMVHDTSFGGAATGPYRLYFARAPGANKGGRLNPGGFAEGELQKGALDSYTFAVQKGQNVYLSFVDVAGDALSPGLTVYDPTGVALTFTGGSDPISIIGTDVASFAFTAMSNGTYTAVLHDNSFNSGATGRYRLYYVLAPGATSGGPLIPGGDIQASLARGALDSYTFTALAGQAVIVQAADVDNTALYPGLTVYDPNGVLLTYTGGSDAISIVGEDVAMTQFAAKTTGTYTAVVHDASNTKAATGPYRIFYALAPGPTTGGPLHPDQVVSGTLAVGALDSYTLNATQGQAFTLRCDDLSTDRALTPALTVYDPSGALLTYTGGTDAISFVGADTATFAFRAQASGPFTIVVHHAFYSPRAEGPYKLTATAN